MKRAVWMAGMLLLAAAAWAAGPGDEQIRDAEKGWAAALISGDQGALNRVLSDNLVYGHASGAVDSKKSYVEKIKSGAAKYDAVEWGEMTVKSVTGDTAVAHGHIRMAGKTAGQVFDNKNMMILHVWVKQGGRWQLAAHQTAMPPAPPR